MSERLQGHQTKLNANKMTCDGRCSSSYFNYIAVLITLCLSFFVWHCIVGGIPEDVDEKVLHAAFIPFGDIMDIQIPLDYETGLQS